MLPHNTTLTKYVFAVFILLAIGYAFFEARNMLYGPNIVINAPAGGISVTDDLVEITGTAKNVAKISMNGQAIFIDDEGVFREKRLLVAGINRFAFDVEDKFGREKREVLELVYTPPRDEGGGEADAENSS